MILPWPNSRTMVAKYQCPPVFFCFWLLPSACIYVCACVRVNFNGWKEETRFLWSHEHCNYKAPFRPNERMTAPENPFHFTLELGNMAKTLYKKYSAWKRSCTPGKRRVPSSSEKAFKSVICALTYIRLGYGFLGGEIAFVIGHYATGN